MERVRSAGVLVFRKEPELSFLLMKHAHRYDLPKGHVEPGETEKQAALRELCEETGIPADNLQLDERFHYQSVYYPRYRRLGGQKVEKTLVVYLGWLLKDQPILPTEHHAHEWVRWLPPHQIQVQMVDSLLTAVEAHFQAFPD